MGRLLDASDVGVDECDVATCRTQRAEEPGRSATWYRMPVANTTCERVVTNELVLDVGNDERARCSTPSSDFASSHRCTLSSRASMPSGWRPALRECEREPAFEAPEVDDRAPVEDSSAGVDDELRPDVVDRPHPGHGGLDAGAKCDPVRRDEQTPPAGTVAAPATRPWSSPGRARAALDRSPPTTLHTAPDPCRIVSIHAGSIFPVTMARRRRHRRLTPRRSTSRATKCSRARTPASTGVGYRSSVSGSPTSSPADANHSPHWSRTDRRHHGRRRTAGSRPSP